MNAPTLRPGPWYVAFMHSHALAGPWRDMATAEQYAAEHDGFLLHERDVARDFRRPPLD
jgi:hypothetical protein